MSAITGLYFLDGYLVDLADIKKMSKSLEHRGTDASGIWCEGSIGLGNQLLWTTQESISEKLPYEDKERGLVITADARIDNRDELIKELDLDKAVSDSQIILYAYSKFGETCVQKLLGDFTFAVWDKRKRKLFCARDHMGIRPFYYYYLPNKKFLFGSEIKALFSLSGIPRKLNEVRVAEYLLSLFDDKEITLYENILRLPPGHSLTVDCNGLKLSSYWTLNPKSELYLSSDEEYEEAFREIFTKAVKRRTRSAYPIGSFLSGGLDSSSIVCTALKFLENTENKEINTFSFVFDDIPECDEKSYINIVLSHGAEKLKSHFVRGDKLSPLLDLEKVLFHQDEAFYAPNLFLHWTACKAAQEKGVRVLLDGLDGDTTVSHGQLRIAELFQNFHWVTMLNEIVCMSKFTNRSPWQVFLQYGFKPSVFSHFRQAYQKIRHFNLPHIAAINASINKRFAKQIGLTGIEETKGRWGWEKPSRTSKEEHFSLLNMGLIPFTLELTNKAASAFSIEPRYPFFDKELVEFCFSLPSNQKLRNGWTRSIMRRALKGVLPPEIQWRKNKSNLSRNFTNGLLTFEQKTLDEAIIKNSQIIEKYVDLERLQKTYDKYKVTKGVDESMIVWQAVTLWLWLLYTDIST